MQGFQSTFDHFKPCDLPRTPHDPLRIHQGPLGGPKGVLRKWPSSPYHAVFQEKQMFFNTCLGDSTDPRRDPLGTPRGPLRDRPGPPGPPQGSPRDPQDPQGRPQGSPGPPCLGTGSPQGVPRGPRDPPRLPYVIRIGGSGCDTVWVGGASRQAFKYNKISSQV